MAVVAGSNTPVSGGLYCISGLGNALLFSQNYGSDRPHTVNILPSIDGNASYEIVVGTKYGDVSCYSGGLNATSISDLPLNITQEYRLGQNYPNPFNPSTTIGFYLPQQTKVTLKVFNVLGQEVGILLNDISLNAGDHSVEFNGAHLTSGIYICRLESKLGILSHKMMLMK